MAEPRRYTFKNIFYEATRLCDLACPMCMAGSNNSTLVRESVRNELSTDEIVERVFKTAHEIGVDTITWSGGEFLLRKDALELVRLATEHGYSSIVTTNAKKTTRESLIELNEVSGRTVVVAVGINAINNQESWTRDTECDKSVQVLEWCEELGIRRNVVVTIGKHNLATIDETLQWLEDRNIPYNRSPFTARGSGCDYWEQLHFTREDMERHLHPALRKHPLGYISYTPFFLSPEVHDKYSKGVSNVSVPQNPSIGCWCGTWLGLSAEGEVSPCAILIDEVNCGNVRDKTFQEIIDTSPVFQQILDRSQLKGRCGRCRYQYTCGGCRAMAWFEHGDIMAEDPTCFFEPKDRSTVSEHEEETNRMFKRYAFMKRHAEQLLENERKARDAQGSEQRGMPSAAGK